MANSTLPHPDRLQGSRTLVIGGTAGIGYAVASGALSHGGAVHITSSQPTNVSSATEQLRTIYPTAAISSSAADLSDPLTIERAIRTTLEAATSALGGPLDHIVYTAGERPRTSLPVTLASVEAPDAYQLGTVRYLGPLLVAKLLAQKPGTYLAQSKNSSVTFTSGVRSIKPVKGYAAVVGVAAAVEALGRAMAVEAAPVRVNVVLLGAVGTGLLDRLPEGALEALAGESLVGAIGRPEEAAEAYLFCMRCGFVTGQKLVVDGGALCV